MKNLINQLIRFIWGLKRPSKQTNIRLLHERGENISSFIIRDAKPEDIPALAALHVKTWSDTYWNVRHPPTYATRENQWRDQFEKIDGSWFCFVIENEQGKLVGFSKGHSYSSEDLPG
jgi:RimJ/RimL family protein N-acetyltransferase